MPGGTRNRDRNRGTGALPAKKAAVKAYSHEVREEAFQLYCQGLSLRQIALRLSEVRGIRLDHTTVAVWVHRYGWPERRLRLHRRLENVADKKWAREAARLLSRLTCLREDILDAAAAYPFKSAEGAVRSLATVQKVIGSLIRPRDDSITLDQLETVMATILQVLQRDEVLGPVLAQRQEAIMARIEALLAGRSDDLGSGPSDLAPA